MKIITESKNKIKFNYPLSQNIYVNLLLNVWKLNRDSILSLIIITILFWRNVKLFFFSFNKKEKNKNWFEKLFSFEFFRFFTHKIKPFAIIIIKKIKNIIIKEMECTI